jgi:autotransporter-associated beta strand protein
MLRQITSLHALGLVLASAAAAAPLTWGPGGNGGSGIWNTNSSANWWNGSSNIVWPATSSGDDDAIFPATAGPVTISGGVTANDISFTANGYLIAGDLLTLDGAAPAISTSTGVSAEISSAIACAAGFQKNGDGTLILSGTHTYTADTTVAAGTLDLASSSSLKFAVTNAGATIVTGPGTAVFRGAFDIDTSAVVTDTGMIWTLANVADQSFDSTFSVTGFDAVGDLWTKSQGSRKWTFDKSTGELTLDVPNTPFQDWAQTNITDIEPTADDSPLADPDGDGTVNLSEFAFNGNPLDGSDHGFLTGQTAAVPTIGNALILTFATRAGATFVGNSTTLDGLTYTVLGSTDLAGFASPVTEVSPAIIPAGWPAPAAGYEYHTFRLNASTGLTAKGFLRLKIATAPVP